MKSHLFAELFPLLIEYLVVPGVDDHFLLGELHSLWSGRIFLFKSTKFRLIR